MAFSGVEAVRDSPDAVSGAASLAARRRAPLSSCDCSSESTSFESTKSFCSSLGLLSCIFVYRHPLDACVTTQNRAWMVCTSESSVLSPYGLARFFFFQTRSFEALLSQSIGLFGL